MRTGDKSEHVLLPKILFFCKALALSQFHSAHIENAQRKCVHRNRFNACLGSCSEYLMQEFLFSANIETKEEKTNTDATNAAPASAPAPHSMHTVFRPPT
jgi:hypothetical protein